MRKGIFIVLLLVLFLFPVSKILAENSICAFYFTFIGCPNCAYTDPIVLNQWIKKYPNLVIIEYGWRGGDWENPNSKFFGDYTKEYKTQAAVPQLVFDKSNIKLGRIEVPKGESYIKSKNSNSCPLIDKSVSFENLNLNELPAFPKIWANQRVLIKLSENEYLFQWNGESPPKTIGKEEITQKELKELLFTENIFEKLKNKVFDIVKPQKVEFSGSVFPRSSGFVPYAEFENAMKIKVSENLIASKPEENQNPNEEINQNLKEETINLPFIGKIETKKFSLPVLT
ncbi:hypothetical protein J7K44_01290, partial [bacterium]|nr:hypothetical protein [bacterium]